MVKQISKPPQSDFSRETENTETTDSKLLNKQETPLSTKNSTSYESNNNSGRIALIIGGIFIGLVILVGGYLILNKNKGFYGGGNVKITHEGDGKVTGVRVRKNRNNLDDGRGFDGEASDIKRGAASSCQSKYDKLFSINGFDFDTYCIGQNVRSGSYEGEVTETKHQNIVLIFDASGSMAGMISGQHKIDMAKNAAKKFIDQISGEKDVSLDIIVYGHKGSNSASQKGASCAGIEEVYHLGSVNAEVAKSKLDNFNATGWTPIADSLEKAKSILSSHKNERNFILLVSDGKETCNGNPVAVTNNIKKSGFDIKVNVIGFDVGGVDEAQLKAIAEAGDGDYFEAKNAYDLELAFQKHKQMLNEADFAIGQTVNNLYDISYIIHSYNQCRAMLEREKIAMMLDINVRELAGEKCKKGLNNIYQKHYQDVKLKLNQYYKNGINNFEKNNIKNK